MKRTPIILSLVCADVLAVVGAYLLAFFLRFQSGLLPISIDKGVPSFAPYAKALPLIAVLWPLAYALRHLYAPRRGASRVDEAYGLGVASFLATVLLFGIDGYLRLYHQAGLIAGIDDPANLQALRAGTFQFSRLFVATFLVTNVALTVTARAAVHRAIARRRARGQLVRRVLVLGAGDLGATVVRAIHAHPDQGYQVIGLVDDDPITKGTIVEGAPVLGTTDEVFGLVQRERIHELVSALPGAAHDEMLRLFSEASKEGVDVKVVPDLLQFVAFRAGFESLGGVPVLNLSDDPLGPGQRFVKRTFDIACAGLGLVALSPALAGLALLVRASSSGPIIFRQERLGQDGRRFRMYKFRTMREDAEWSTGPVFAAAEDPRATPIGRWLRRWSIDELPQLWNVLRGDMSLVGPRPERPSFVVQFKESIPRYMLRHKVRSGMTGWAQVNGWRGNTSIPIRIEHDLYYVRNWSLGFDLRILLLTLFSIGREP